ncbi:PAS domain S-box protein [bacterium]|nr:PAS domain S-box protein [bacterium]
MKDSEKTKEQLLAELKGLRKKLRASERDGAVNETRVKPEDKYGEITELLPLAVFEIDLKGKILFANRGAFKMFGYSKKDLTAGLSVFQMIVPGDHPRVRSNIERVIKGIRNVDLEYTGIDKGGKTFPVHVYSSPIVERNKAVGLRGIIIDVSNLKAIENQLSTAFAYSPIPTAVFSSEGDILSYNSAVEKLTGFSMQGIKHIAEWVNQVFPEKKYRNFAMFNIRKLLDGKPMVVSEFVLTSKSGVKRVVEFEVSSFEGGLIVQLLDITDRKRAEDELLKNHEYLEEIVRDRTRDLEDLNEKLHNEVQERQAVLQSLESALETVKDYREIIDRSPAMVFLWRVAKGWPVEFVSENVDKILGYSKGDFISGKLSWLGITHPEDAPRLEREIEFCLKNNITEWNQEYRVLTKSGEICWVEDRNIALKGVKGDVTHIQGIVLDVTERKNFEDALAKEKEQLDVTLHSIGDAVITTDAQGRITMLNSVAENLTGWKKREVIGINLRKVFNIVNESTGAPCPNPVEEVLNTGRVVDVTDNTVLITRDNRKRIISDSGAPIVDREGNIIGVVLVFREITEQIRNQRIQNLLFMISEATSSAESLEKVLELTYRELNKLIDASNFYIALYNERKNTFEFPVDYDQDSMDKDLDKQMKGSLTEYVYRTGKPLMLTRDQHEKLISQGKFKGIVGKPSAIWVGVPLRVERKTIGVISVQNYQDPETYSKKDLDVLSYIADHLALAIAHKNAETALMESEERFRNMFGNIPMGIYRTTPEGRVLMANPTLVKMLGYSSLDELKQRNLEKNGFTSASPRKQFKKLIEEKGQLTGFESEWRRKDGEILHVRENARVVYDHEGKVQFYEGTIEDITEHKRAENALQTSEIKFRTLTENLNVGVFRTTPGDEGELVEINPALLKIFGYKKREEFLKIRAKDLYSDPAERKRINHKITRNGFIKGEEVKLRKRDNSTFFGSISAVLVKDSQGQIAYFDGIVEDITERKRLSEELQKSESRYRELFNNISNGVAVYEAVNDGEDFIFSDFNITGATIDGIKKEDVIGKSVKEVFPGIVEFGLFEIFQRVYRTGAPESYPLTLYQDQRIKGWRENYIYKLPTGEIVAVYDDVTQRKEAELALRESEKRYRNLFVNVPIGIYQATPEGQIIIANPALVKMLGYNSYEELAQKNQDEEIFKAGLISSTFREQLNRDGEINGFEFPWARKDNTLMYGLENVRAVYDDNGNLKYYEGTVEDVTERREAEEKLRKSEEKYRFIFQESPSVNIILDQETRIIDMNKVMLEATGYTRDELLGKYVVDLVAPAKREEYTRAIREIYTKQINRELEVDFIASNGEERSILFSPGQVFIYEEGKLSGVLFTGIDITRRKKIENALRESEERHRVLLESIQTPVIALRENMTVLYCNRAFGNIVGQSVEKLNKKNIIEVFPAIEETHLFDAYQEVIRTGRNVELETEFNGHYYNSRVFRTLWGILALMEDVTERRKAKERIQHLNKLLRAIRNVNQLISVEKDREKLIDGACQSLVETRGYIGAWIILFDEQRELECSAAAGLGGTYNLLIESIKGGIFPSNILKTLENPGTNIITDPDSSCRDCPVLEICRSESSIATRLEHNEVVYGILSVCCKRGLTKDQEELTLFKEVADDIAFALHDLDEEQKRSRAEAALKESEEKYRNLVERSNDGICIIKDELIVYCNPRLAEITGFSVKELMEKPFTEFLYPEEREKVAMMYAQRMAGEEIPHLYDTLLLQKNGDPIDVELNAGVINYEGSAADLVFIHDISNRRRAREIQEVLFEIAQASNISESLEDLLHTIQVQLGRLLNTQNFFVALYDQDTDTYSFPYDVDRYERGHSMDQIRLKKSFTDYVRRTGKPLLADEKISMELEEQGEVELVGTPSRLWLGVPLKTGRGVIGVVALQSYDDRSLYTERDLSLMNFVSDQIAISIERKRSEEALRESEERYRLLVDLSPISIALHSENKIIFANKASIKLMGAKSPGEVLGKSIFDFVHPDTRKDVKKRVATMLEQGKSVPLMEEVFIRLDGKEIEVEVVAAPISYAGKPAIQVVFSDISKRKQSERELKKTMTELERSNSELEQFAYIASHDLREPLRKISAFGELLKGSLEGKLNKDQQENLGYVIDGAERMQRMINDLLTYSRITSRAKPPEAVNLNKILEDIIAVDLATKLNETGGTINVPEPLPEVRADPSQMQQLFQNIIANGLKFRREGIPPIITITSQEAENNMVRINIRDNGIGIDKLYHEQIFVMFKRVYGRSKYEGSGIGLAVCKRIVQRHGGQIAVESSFQEGSNFWFTLPKYANSNNIK